MNSIKILIIGDKNTGKTALVEKIVKNTFSIANHIPTFGVNFSQKIINEKNENEIKNKMKNKMKNKKTYKLEFWDCSGSEEYIYFINMLYPEVNYILLCFDVSEKKSYESLSLFWLPFLKENKVNARIIIIGNKSDLQNDYSIQNTDIITSQYDLSLNIYPTIFLFSAKTDTEKKYTEFVDKLINN